MFETYEYDPAKNARNLDKHGVALTAAVKMAVHGPPTTSDTTRPALPRLASEQRQQGTGMDAAMVKAIADLLGAVAWPVVIGGAFIGFRADFSKLIRNLKHVKWGDKEGNWDDGASKASEAIDVAAKEQAQLAPAPPNPQLEGLNAEPELEAPWWLAPENEGIRNSAIVLGEWAHLEQSLTKLADEVGRERERSGMSSLRALVSARVMTEALAEGIRELYKLRNQVAHSEFEPDDTATAKYSKSAREARQVLKAVTLTLRADKAAKFAVEALDPAKRAT